MPKQLKRNKQVFEGYTIESFQPVWTFWNYLNLGALIQKNRYEAEIRYDAEWRKLPVRNKIIKVRITVEKINE